MRDRRLARPRRALHGTEQLLVRRAHNEAVARKLLARIAWWEAHLARHGARTDHNPSPGNAFGGITTVYDEEFAPWQTGPTL